MDVKKFDTKPVALVIKKIIKENEDTNTYVFDYTLGAKPGQFVMLWIPGAGEKPISVAYDNGKEFWLTVCRVGQTTAELFKLKEGDKVGVRGPFGTFYKFKPGEHLTLIAGGYGVAPMYFVAHEAGKLGCKIDFLLGARTKSLLLYTQKILGLGNVNLKISTNDGSAGIRGFVTELLRTILLQDSGNKVDRVFSCGPEVMMKAVGELIEDENSGAEYFLSLEKYMKCGFGVCGQCAVDDSGECVCTKGPVVSWSYAKKLKEFGKYHRDAQGKKYFFNLIK